MPPYRERFPVGAKVRIASRAVPEAFARDWKLHHRPERSRIASADRPASVKSVACYHGGDVLYELDGVPGTWHESCLVGAEGR